MNKMVMMGAAAGMLAGCINIGSMNGNTVNEAASRGEAVCCGDPVMGNWSVKLSYADGRQMNASSMIFSRDAEGNARALVLWRWGSPSWCTDVKVDGNRFSLIQPYGSQLFEGVVIGDRIIGRNAPCDRETRAVTGAWLPFEGVRNPPVPADVTTADAKLGEPIDLLKDGLDGWALMNPKAKNGWSFRDGVLSNRLGLKADGSWAGGGSNLASKRADFYDFNLEYDVRVPAKSNSGVYLRGRFEIQVVDSYGKPVDCHNMAAYYGRVAPKVSAEKPAGEWQHVSVTLYRQHLTVALNGVTIIANTPVVGVTGGAIDANLYATGPIYLQGDHSDADYKNMILRPAM